MTPGELSGFLTERARRAALIPQHLEVAATKTVYAGGFPPGVSVRITRLPNGVHVALSGRGARALAKRTVPALRAAARDTVAGVR